MFCSNCGKEVDDSAEICLNCGCRVTNTKREKKKNGCVSVFIGLFIFFIVVLISMINLVNTLDETISDTKKNDSCIPLDKQTYNSIKVGGTYKQLEKLKDYCGEVAVESSIENVASGGVVVFYGKPIGSNANFTVMNGKIVSKAQLGLE